MGAAPRSLEAVRVRGLAHNDEIDDDQDGEKKVVVEDRKDTDQTCTDEQKAKVDEQISAYVKGSS